MPKQTIPPDKTATKQQTKPQPTVEPLAGVAEFAGELILFGGKSQILCTVTYTSLTA